MLNSIFELVLNIGFFIPYMLLGYFAGRYTRIDGNRLTWFFTFLIVPVFVLGFAIKLDMQPEYYLLPVVVVLVNGLSAVLSYVFAKKHFRDRTPNLIGLSVGTSNTGNFGMPVVASLFEPQWTAVFLLFTVGGIINMNTVAYYLALRGEYDWKQSLLRMMRLPVVYALVAGMVIGEADIPPLAPHLQAIVDLSWAAFNEIFIFIGIFIIGMSFAEVRWGDFKGRWLRVALLMKFGLMPVIVFLFVALDIYIFHLFATPIHHLFAVFAFLPIARNAAAYAMMLKLYPNKAVVLLAASTIISFLALPIVFLCLS